MMEVLVFLFLKDNKFFTAEGKCELGEGRRREAEGRRQQKHKNERRMPRKSGNVERSGKPICEKARNDEIRSMWVIS